MQQSKAEPSQPNAPARGRNVRASKLWKAVASAPLSLLFAVSTIVIACVAGLEPARWMASAEATLSQARWWTPLSSLFVSGSVLGVVVAAALCLSVLVVAERSLGSRRLALSAMGGGALTVVLTVFVEAGIARWPGLEDVDLAEIASPTIAVTVAAMAASSAAGVVWRRRVRMSLAAVVLLFALYSSDPASWARVVALVLGAVLGSHWFGAPSTPVRWRSSLEERRRWVSVSLLLMALGPMAGLLSGGGRGPLAQASALFSEVDHSLQMRCAHQSLRVCDHLSTAVLTRGLGPALLAAVPLALLVVASLGLRQGRRAAWFLGLATSGLLAAAALAAVFTGAANWQGVGGALILDAALWVVTAIGLPTAAVAVLIATRRSFEVKASRKAARRLLAVVVIALLALAAGYLLAETLLRHSWNGPLSFAQLRDQTLRRFLPPLLLYDVAGEPVPHAGPALVIWQWVGVVFWAIFMAAMLRLYRSARVGADAAREDVLTVMRATEGGTMAWLGTWEGVKHWFSADRSAAVSYRVVDGVALVISDPLCDAGEREKTLRDFIAFAMEHGYLPVFYSVHEATALALRGWGFSEMTVAEEAVIHPQTWSMAGKSGEKVRQPFNRMTREGVRAEWTAWAELTPRHNLQIHRISEEWISERSLPEMGFTLGSLGEMKDPEVRLMVAIDQEDRVLGVTSWLPSWTLGRQTGWTLDVMRRSEHAPNGVMEFLIASAALQAKADGLEVLSLSGAPLATSEGRSQGAFISAVLDRVAEALEPVYGFDSLNKFKKKFQPEHQRLVMSYADPLRLGTIAAAVAKAYMPSAARKDIVALARGMMDRGE